MVSNILTRRKDLGITDPPMILWEPVPGVCSPQDWPACKQTIPLVTVITPNINEAASFHRMQIDEHLPFPDFKLQAEALARKYVPELAPSGAVVFRCGRHGCFVAWRGGEKWLPAYHRDAKGVVDPTGGGNAFCGGFCVGYVLGKGDFVEAGKYGNIAAAVVIEQFGLPRLESLGNDVVVNGDAGLGRELWNGVSMVRRRDLYHHWVECL